LQAVDGPHELALQRRLILEVAQVLIAGEQLVGALPRQDDLDVLRGHLREQEVRHRAAHERRIEVLDRAHDLGQHVRRLAGAVDALVMLAVQVPGDDARGQQVGAVLGPDGERLQALAALLAMARRDRGDDRRVQPAGEEHADGDVAHHLALHRVDQDLARRGERLQGRLGQLAPVRSRARGRLVADVDDGVGEALEAALGRPVTARREALDERHPIGCEGADLRREAHAAVALRPVQRLDPDRVAGRQEAAVVAGDEEREHALELGQRRGTALVEQVQRDLVVRARLKLRRAERGAHLLVVVDLAVADEPDVASRVGERLAPAADVDDRQPPVPEPGAFDVHSALVVGSAMHETPEHPLGLTRGLRTVDGGDAAHLRGHRGGHVCVGEGTAVVEVGEPRTCRGDDAERVDAGHRRAGS